ncbi:methyltransferase domain-containing protein [Nocardiopsis sp. NPDC007018]|uniref:methyltransferase domain-containing protein n=1 Tax=Nocardiopsis sp. NPDC007018 TaxID=3155721 RepID=UPI0033FA9AE9
MSNQQFTDFFEPYAGNVEGFYEVAYWKLSDELIKELMRRHLNLPSGGHLIDVGGGTGRWALWAAAEFQAEVTVADKSPRMLEQARHNVAEAGGEDRVTLVECDLQDASELPSDHYDAMISTYGVLSFLDRPADAFRTLHRVLKPGGIALLMSHSLSNALASKVNRDGAGVEELRELSEKQIVRWAPHVPPLRVFSAQDLRGLGEEAGFEALGVFGVTSVVSPGPEDFGYPYDKISAVSQALQDPDYFATVLDLELRASERGEWAERGTNLMLKVRKPL